MACHRRPIHKFVSEKKKDPAVNGAFSTQEGLFPMSMTDLTVFRREGLDIRVVTGPGTSAPWWVASDVARALGYSATSAMLRSLDDDDKGVHNMHTLGGVQSLSVITEAGLYDAVLRSNLPTAKAFKRWVIGEVLPSIRKTGQYVAPTSELDQIKALHSAVGTLLERQAIDAPKVEAFDRFLDSSSLIKIEVAARQVGVGRQTAFRLLRELGILQRYSRSPMQQYAHRFKEVPSTHENSSGVLVTDFTTKVRPEHFEWLVGRLESALEREVS